MAGCDVIAVDALLGMLSGAGLDPPFALAPGALPGPGAGDIGMVMALLGEAAEPLLPGECPSVLPKLPKLPNPHPKPPPIPPRPLLWANASPEPAMPVASTTTAESANARIVTSQTSRYASIEASCGSLPDLRPVAAPACLVLHAIYEKLAISSRASLTTMAAVYQHISPRTFASMFHQDDEAETGVQQRPRRRSKPIKRIGAKSR
jgi:hypothetical protein